VKKLVNNLIDILFDGLMKGNASLITSDNIRGLNNIALEIYNTPVLNPMQVDTLKKIIMICNVLYNRTDMTILPIEDGFYDLLLEKYKTYDSNFQVGSAVVEFRNFIENDLDNPTKIATSPISFIKKQDKDEFHQEVYDNIMRTGKPMFTKYDFYKSPISFTSNRISKRSHNTEHNHPTLVGTLDKAKFVTNKDAIDAGAFNDSNVKILERDFFQDHINKGIIKPNQRIGIVCELKYDGISVEADCGFTLSSARTRGDTGIGVASDITPILKDYVFKNASCMIGEEEVGVKFEAIMTKSNLETFNRLRGRSYVNCRSAIVGLFGSSDAYLYRDLITLVPLALDREQFKYKFTNRLEEIDFLNRVFVSHGEPLRYCYFEGTVSEVLYSIKVFWDEAKLARDYLNFMYDGIVISYVDENIRETLGRKNYINKYSMAVKFDPLEKQTIFRGYTYEVGQHGNITPMIHYDPVEFLGTIHTKSTGSSLNRFNELGLKYGDYISVKYVNDVMPYVSRVECEHNRNNPNPKIEIISECPLCGTKLVTSDSNKSLICPNLECAGRSIQRMVNMFSKMNIKGFADATFRLLKDKDHLYKLYEYTDTGLPVINRKYYIDTLGVADGEAFSNILNDLISKPINDYIIMGSLGFNSIAHKKWQNILEFISIEEMNILYNTTGNFAFDLSNIVPNIGEITAITIEKEWGFFKNDIEFILRYMNIISSKGSMKNCKAQIRFSGFRYQQLAEQLSTIGYDASDSSVTKKTDILLVPYDGFSSSKVTKAMKNPNTKIISLQEFIDNSTKYIGVKLK
jgi:NAD-dependent DNA ligase